MTEISLIVPVLNEEDSIQAFVDVTSDILEKIGGGYEIIFVDDGSTDTTVDVVMAERAKNESIKLIKMTRNFGKEAAMTAGMDFSSGAAVIPMDVDMQDPPELIYEFVRLWREGFDVVYGQRVDRSSDTRAKRKSADLFYSVFNAIADNKIEANVGDFRLMSRQVVADTLKLRERNRFMKGVFAWVGHKAIAVPYTRPVRAHGESKFNKRRLWRFAIDGITSFSTAPLRIWTYVGLVVAAIALAYMLIVMGRTLILGRDVPGYASLMTVVLALGAVQLISLGVIGEYLGRLYLEAKQRPLYLVKEAAGFERSIDDAMNDNASETKIG